MVRIYACEKHLDKLEKFITKVNYIYYINIYYGHQDPQLGWQKAKECMNTLLSH